MKCETLKQQEAIERQEAWDSLKPKQKYESLDRRLGKNVGALKQRVFLIAESSLDDAVIFGIQRGAGPKIMETLRKRVTNKKDSQST